MFLVLLQVSELLVAVITVQALHSSNASDERPKLKSYSVQKLKSAFGQYEAFLSEIDKTIKYVLWYLASVL